MKVVFGGPSLSGLGADALVGVELRPPAQCGDVARAARDGAAAIGLIDGSFETTASVWHKELLWALSKGVRLLGSSSMGALRAAETYPFGMRGVGAVYRLYRSGVLRDDDEVAILHAPTELGSKPLTDAMVNIRFTLRAARRQGLISRTGEAGLCAIGKTLFYKERTFERVLELADEQPDLPDEARALRTALRWIYRDIKREDAQKLLLFLRKASPHRSDVAAGEFPATSFWAAFEARYLAT